ncbi:MAG: inositol monophosphatase family protein [Euzebya sp.]
MQDLLEFALSVARQGGQEALSHFRGVGLQVDRKQDHSPVTIADRQAEARMRELIASRHPADAIVGEEHPDTPGTSGRTWYLDPIDGTKSFVHGVPLFTTLVACDDRDGPAVGVINAPALDEATWAGRGLGCFHQGAATRVSDTADLASAYVMTSGLEWWPTALRPKVLDPPFVLRTWGDGYGYMLVATGRVEAMVDPQAEVWDLAPLPVIMAEAGGRLTGLDGSAGIMTGSAVATNGHVHQALLEHLA